MRLLLSRKGGGQGGEQVSWTESSNRNRSSSSSNAGASQDAKLSSCPIASYGVDLDRIDSRLNVNICVGVARGREGKQRSKQTKRRTEGVKERRSEGEINARQHE